MMSGTALLRKLDSGDISNVLSEVKAVLSAQSVFSHRILLRISNLCIERVRGKEPIITDDNEALELVLLCCQTINLDSKNEETTPANSLILVSLYNVYFRFCSKKNIQCAIKLFDEAHPILKRMVPSMSDEDQKYMHNFMIVTHRFVVGVADSILKEDSQASITVFDLFDRVLLLSSFTSPDVSLSYVVVVIRTFCIKYEKCHGLERAEKIACFNNILLEKLVSFSYLSPRIKCKEANDQVFGHLVLTLQQFLRINMKAGLLHSTTLTCWLKLSSLFSLIDIKESFDLIARIVRLFTEKNSEDMVVKEFLSICKIFEKEKHKISSPLSWVIYISGILACEKSSLLYVEMKSFDSMSVLSALHCFTKLLSELLLDCSNSECSGANGEVCTFKSDVYLAFRSQSAFLSCCLDFHKEGEKKERKKQWSEQVILIEASLKCLESLLKRATDRECVKCNAMEGHLCDSFYNAGIICYNNEDWINGRLFLLSAVSFFYANKRDLNEAALSKIDASLLRLSQCCEKFGETKEAKAAVLLNTILHLKSSTSQRSCFVELWSNLQNRKPADAITADQFLKWNPSILKTMCPTFALNLKLVPGLLLWELSCYAKHKMVDSSIILNAWQALTASKPSALHLIEGSALAAQALFSSSDTVAWHDIICASLSSWMCDVKCSHERAIALCAMGVHYHVKFLILAQRHFNENESCVEELTIYSRNPTTVRKPGDVIDPKDVCQIRSSFSNLTLLREQELLDLLDTAVNYWDESLRAGLNIEDHSAHTVVSLSGTYLLQAAHLNCLWGHSAGAAKTFKVCCSFAEKMHLDDLQLQALSGLMSTIEVEKDCITESEALLNRLKNHPKIDYLSLVYATSRALQALRSKSYQDGMLVLKNVIDYKPTMSTVWCHTFSKLLQAAYSLIPETKFGSGSVAARQGLSLSINHVKDKRLSQSPLVFAALVHQVLSSSLWIGRYYRLHQMPREARSFLKPELMLALKLGLATRAAEFICELAFVDLVTEKIDEARSKIYDLEGIIQPSVTEETSTIHTDDENDMFDSTNLNVPKDTRNVLGASPTFKEVFCLPISGHEMSCKCYSCRNSSVQNVWLMFGHLQAKINMLRFEAHSAIKIYRTVFKAAEKVLKRSTQNVLLHDSLLQQHDIACSEVLLWLDFVDLLVMYGKDDEARKQNKSILGLLRNLKTDDKLLLSIFLEQKLCISKILLEKDKKAGDCDKSLVNTLSTTGLIIDKTPENTHVRSADPQGKRRKPLKLITTTPKGHIAPLTDQQFFTPKAPIKKEIFKDSDDDTFKDSDDDIFKDSDDDIFKDGDDKGTCQPSVENISIPSKKAVFASNSKKTLSTTSSKIKEEKCAINSSNLPRSSKVKVGSALEENTSASSKIKSTRSKTGGLSARPKLGVTGGSVSAEENVKGRSSRATSRADTCVATSKSTTRVTRQKKV
ncbi:Glutamate--tRNA ligase 1 [Frankliniella fusca]|uniref:Glutamate--tRNA ligase 1 n=1 Tax=Frankliniella fusca TaxID=407009 RepID=A0AAE1HU23_9NEOP|nr:Glutamate--tRNA ligase 1 [Frankliniella fusca]